jgi:predicted transcriptional regulator
VRRRRDDATTVALYRTEGLSEDGSWGWEQLGGTLSDVTYRTEAQANRALDQLAATTGWPRDRMMVRRILEPRATTSQAQRTRKMVQVTLSDAARERLRDLADRSGQPASRIVETMILAAPLPRRR